MLSTVTGEICRGEELDANYWARNLREPVRFAEAASDLARDHDIFLEVSPHPVLVPALRSGLLAAGREDARAVVSLRRDRPEKAALLESLGELYKAGCRVDWAKLHPTGGRVLRLPTTSWQHRPYWISPRRRIQWADRVNHPFLQGRLDSRFLPGVVYEAELDPERHSLLREHRVGEIRIVPGSVLLELVLAAGRMHHGANSRLCLEAVELPGFVAMGPGERCQLQVLLRSPDYEGGQGFEVLGRVYSLEGEPGQWSSHARGQLTKFRDGKVEVDQAWSPLQLCEPFVEGSEFCVNPAWVDDALRRALKVAATESGRKGVWAVERIARVELPAGSRGEASVGHRFRVSDAQSDRLSVDLVLADADDRAVMKLEGVELVHHEPSAVERTVMGSFADWLYAVQWQDRPAARAVQPASPERWLVFADEGGVGTALSARVEAAGGTCVCATRHETFTELAPRRFGVRLNHETDIARLFDQGPFDRVVHLWALDAPPVDTATTASDVLRSQSLGCKSVSDLVRACLATEARPRIWIATSGAERVLPDDRATGLAQSPLWGLGRALALEHPELWGGLLDLDPAADPETQAELLSSLLAHVDGEDHVAIRGGRQFVARLEQKLGRRLGDMPQLQEEATYLITGGLGGLGLSLARWLVDRGARHLVLLGRSGTVSSEARELLLTLDERGVEVRIERADVSEESELRRALEAIERDLPPLRGVFHLAGVLDYGSLSEHRAEGFERAFAAKALGAWNLHRLTGDLDLFVMFSSLSATFASKGMANYAAANHFLDALALHRAAQGLPALSASWGPWRDSGLAARAGDTYLRRLEAMGLTAITSDEGFEALGALIEQGTAHAIVAPLRLDPYLEYAGGDSPPALFRDLAAARCETPTEVEAPSEVREHLRSMSVEDCKTWVEGRVRELAARVLGALEADQIQPDRLLPELGLDSLSAMEMRDRLERGIGVRIPVRLLFEEPTPRQIARRIADLVREGAVEEAPSGILCANDLKEKVVLAPEVRVADSSLDTHSPTGAAPHQDPKRVLLTGATGFLGAFVLDELLRSTKARVWCLVRAAGAAEARKRLHANLERYGLHPDGMDLRVVPIAGDLGKERLGLDDEHWSSLSTKIDTIYHCGASVDWLLGYAVLQSPNVLGTHEVLRLATEGRRKVVHHVSTIGTLGRGDELVHESKDLLESGGLYNGYVQTKWVAEGLVLRARERGLDASIYRTAFVAGDSTSGAWDTGEFMGSMLRGCIELGAAPDLDVFVGLTPVDYFSRGLVALSRNGARNGEAYHLVNPAPLPFREILNLLAARGRPLEVEPYERWRERAVRVAEASREFALGGYLSMLPQRADHTFWSFPRVGCDETVAILKGAGVDCPPIDEALMATYLRFLQRRGLLRSGRQKKKAHVYVQQSI
jgi:thioester reductase-like protein